LKGWNSSNVLKEPYGIKFHSGRDVWRSECRTKSQYKNW